MRVRAVVLAAAVLAAALMLVPPGAQAADLVVWWEKGFYPEEDHAARELARPIHRSGAIAAPAALAVVPDRGARGAMIRGL